jgi:hypothetical protein
MNKKALYSILLTATLVLILVPQVIVFAVGSGSTVENGGSGNQGALNGQEATGGAGAGGAGGGGSGGGIQNIVGAVARGLTGLGGGLATIGFIVAGITYIASTANPSLMATAKTALVAAVIGIVIILLASTACSFINTLTGAGGQC